jgi:hypothetical protein
VRRRRFEFLYEELSLRLGRLAPRYALWLRLRETGADPESLSRADALRFSERELPAFLAEHGLGLDPRDLRSLVRAVARHDPAVRTPAEWMARI